jgi:small ligand-binding sensory domain FIST
VVEGGAIGVVLEGDVEIRPVVSQGCRPVGKPFVITHSRENFILKLGGRPALEVLVEVAKGLSSRDQKLLQRGPFLGLAIDARKSSFERGDFLVRGIMGLDQEESAVVVADGTIRNGMTVQFLVRDAESAGEDLKQLMKAKGGGETVSPASVGAMVFLLQRPRLAHVLEARPRHRLRAKRVRRPDPGRGLLRSRRDRSGRRTQLPARLHGQHRGLPRARSA